MSKRKEEPKVKKGADRMVLIATLAIALMAFIPNSSTFDHGYVLDDVSAITENYVVQKGTASIPTIWTTNYRYGYWSDPGSLYRPLALTLFAWEWKMWPNEPGPAHVINVLLYTACCVAIYLLLLNWFGRDRWAFAFAAAAIFTLHPIHTEVVANIKSADELLAILFSAISMIAIWKNRDKRFSKWIVLAIIAFFLAISSKESVITLIPILPLAFYFFSDITLKKSWIPTAWLLAPLSFYLLLRKNALGTFSSADVIAGIDNVLVKAEGLEYFATATKICGLYIWKLIVPHPLSHDYSLYQIPLNGISDPYFWFSGLVYLALFWIVYKGWKSRNIFAFSVLFFLITFSLYSNMFIMIGTHFGERLMFLPSLGFSIGLSGLLYAWSTKSSSISFQASKSMLPILLFVLVLLSYGFKTQLRNADWKSEYDLYTADVINSPESSRTHYRLGMAYMKERAHLAKDEKVKNQWLRKAVGELKKAIEIYPGYADAQGELGLAYQRLGYLDLAVERYNIVLAKKPTHKTTLNNMGTVLFNQAKFEQAIDYFLRALKSDPKYKDAMGNLASCYGTIGQYDEAIKWFKKAIDIDPTNASYYYFVGVTYQRMNKPKEAESWLLQAYVLDPSLKPKN